MAADSAADFADSASAAATSEALMADFSIDFLFVLEDDVEDDEGEDSNKDLADVGVVFPSGDESGEIRDVGRRLIGDTTFLSSVLGLLPL